MSNRILTKVQYLEFTPDAGESIYEAMREAVIDSMDKKLPVEFTFNGTRIRIDWEQLVSELVSTKFAAPRAEMQAECEQGTRT